MGDAGGPRCTAGKRGQPSPGALGDSAGDAGTGLPLPGGRCGRGMRPGDRGGFSSGWGVEPLLGTQKTVGSIPGGMESLDLARSVVSLT